MYLCCWVVQRRWNEQSGIFSRITIEKQLGLAFNAGVMIGQNDTLTDCIFDVIIKAIWWYYSHLLPFWSSEGISFLLLQSLFLLVLFPAVGLQESRTQLLTQKLPEVFFWKCPWTVPTKKDQNPQLITSCFSFVWSIRTLDPPPQSNGLKSSKDDMTICVASSKLTFTGLHVGVPMHCDGLNVNEDA